MSFRTCIPALAALVLLAGCAGGDPASPTTTLGGSPSTDTTVGATSVPPPSADGVQGATRNPGAGALMPGRYFTAQNDWTPVTFSFDIAGPGWVAQNDGQTITKNMDVSAREISWSVEILDSLFATPCGTDDRVPLGPSVNDLVAGLEALPDLDVAVPAELTIDGRAGQVFELSLPDGIDEGSCDPPIGIQVWLDKAGGKYLVIGEDARTRVHAVDVDGARFILNANIAKSADRADVAEFEAIVDSITFHP